RPGVQADLGTDNDTALGHTNLRPPTSGTPGPARPSHVRDSISVEPSRRPADSRVPPLRNVALGGVTKNPTSWGFGRPTLDLILIRDRRLSAVLSTVFPGRAAPQAPQG